MATKTVFITDTGLTTWQVPSDFDSLVGIDCIGAGASGSRGGTGGTCLAAGGGAAWARIAALAGLVRNQTVHVHVGVGPTAPTGTTAVAGVDGEDTWFSTTAVAPTSTSEGVLAKGGKASTGTSGATTGGLGGAAADCIGSDKHSGGQGGDCNDNNAGAGGGAAGGPNGDGGAGGDVTGGANGGAGGGGADGGAAGSNGGASGSGVQGGASGTDSTAGGTGAAGASSGQWGAGNPGSHGSGAGGGGNYGDAGGRACHGGIGGDGLGFIQTSNSAVAGPGGGGGGGAGFGGNGGNGGGYGGGGGSSGNGNGNANIKAGNGANGIIIFTYNVWVPPVRDWYAAENLVTATDATGTYQTHSSVTFTPKADTDYAILWHIDANKGTAGAAKARLWDGSAARDSWVEDGSTGANSSGGLDILPANASPSRLTYSVQFAQGGAAGTVSCYRSHIVVIELTADDAYDEDTGQTSVTAGAAEKCHVDLTVPTGGGQYAIIGHHMIPGTTGDSECHTTLELDQSSYAAANGYFYKNNGGSGTYEASQTNGRGATDVLSINMACMVAWAAGAHTAGLWFHCTSNTAYSQDARVLVLRLDMAFSDIHYAELRTDDEAAGGSASLHDIVALNNNIFDGGEYLLLPYLQYSIQDNSESVFCTGQAALDGTVLGTGKVGFNWAGRDRSLFTPCVATLSPGSHSIATQEQNTSGTAGNLGLGSILALKMPPRPLRDVQYAEGLAEQSTTSATVWTRQATLAFTPKADTDYAILWSGSLYLGSTSSDGQADFYDMPNAQELVLQNIEGLGTSPVDYVGVGGLYGLIGHAAGNVLTSAQEAFTANWSTGWSTLTPNNVTAPDGTTTAAKLIEDSSAGQNHEIYTAPISKAASAVMYWGSVWVKRQAGTRSVLLSFDNSTHANYVQVAFNLAVGTASQLSINNFTLHEMFVDKHADGWFHIGARFTTDTDTSINWFVSATNNANPPTTPYNGDGSSGLALWRPRIALASDGPRRTGSTMIRSPDLFGNFTAGGGGLAAAFDGNTLGYDYQAPWCAMASALPGVPYLGLSVPTKVVKVGCWASASDGFVQTSPSVVNVTLQLYGKQGAAPANATDGTQIGSNGPFADSNSAYVEITSTDTETVWDHIWVRMSWDDGLTHSVCFAELAFYAPDLQRSLAVRFKSETAGVTTKMKDARLVALELTADDVYGEKLPRQTQTSGLLDALVTNITVPTGGGSYLIACSCHVDISNISNLVGWYCNLDGTSKLFTRNSGANDANYLSARDTTNRTPWVQFAKKTLAAGAHTLTQSIETDTGITMGIEQARTLFLRLDDYRFGENFYAEVTDANEAAAGSESYTDTAIAFTQTFEGGDYLLLGHCNYTIHDATHSEYAKIVLDDATTLIEQNAESGPYADVECSTAFVATKAALTAASHTLKIQKKNSTGAGTTGTLGVGAIIAIKVPSAEEPPLELIDLILGSDVLDSGLAELADATLLHILSDQPTVFADVATYTLGNGSVTVGAPGAVTGGRKVTVAAVSGTTTDAGDAVAWALVDASRLLATGKLSELVTVGDAAAFDVATFDIKIPVS